MWCWYSFGMVLVSCRYVVCVSLTIKSRFNRVVFVVVVFPNYLRGILVTSSSSLCIASLGGADRLVAASFVEGCGQDSLYIYIYYTLYICICIYLWYIYIYIFIYIFFSKWHTLLVSGFPNWPVGRRTHNQPGATTSLCAQPALARRVELMCPEKAASPQPFPRHVVLTALRVVNATWRSSLYIGKKWQKLQMLKCSQNQY